MMVLPVLTAIWIIVAMMLAFSTADKVSELAVLLGGWLWWPIIVPCAVVYTLARWVWRVGGRSG